LFARKRVYFPPPPAGSIVLPDGEAWATADAGVIFKADGRIYWINKLNDNKGNGWRVTGTGTYQKAEFADNILIINWISGA